MCGELRSCCCCFSLRSGSLIAASFFLTSNLLNVASVVLHRFNIDIPVEACYEEDILVTVEECHVIRQYATTAMLVATLMDCIHALTSFILFFAIFRRKEVLMIPFMSMTLLQTLRMFILSGLSIGVFYLLKLTMIILINSSVIHLVLIMYLGAVVYNYYPKIMKSMFRDWYLDMKKKKDEANLVEPFVKQVAWLDFSEPPSRSESFLTLEIAKDEEKTKCCKDFLCILIPMVVVGAAWTGKEFFLYNYL